MLFGRQVISHCFEIPWTTAHQASVYGICQARTLEGVAVPFFRGSSWPRDWTRVSCIGRRVLYHWTTRETDHGGSTSVHEFGDMWSGKHWRYELGDCISVLLLCNKKLTNLAAYNNKHLLSHGFCWSGNWEWLSWVMLVWGLIKLWSRCQLERKSTESLMRAGEWFTHTAIGRRLPFLNLCHFSRLLENMVASFPWSMQSRKQQ